MQYKMNWSQKENSWHKPKMDATQNEHITNYFFSFTLNLTSVHSPYKINLIITTIPIPYYLYFYQSFLLIFTEHKLPKQTSVYREKTVRKKLNSFFSSTDDSFSRNEVSSVAIFLVAGCSCNRRPIQIYCTWYFSVTPSSPSRCCCAWYSAAR